ncbi:hypothetical protein KHQ81_05635 [Mycoplasmatota bacterium]|nr:hypothetical protein KHQ81_05635 [Mycoplasmatota bacterium]
MTNNKKLVSLIFIVFILLMGVTIWLVFYSLDNNRITPYPDGTEVGYVYIGGKNTWQAENALRKEINKWKNAENLKIELSYQNQAYTIDVDPSIFRFDINKTIQNAIEKEKMQYDQGINVIVVDFSEGNEYYIENLLSEHYDNLKFSAFDIEIIKSEVLKNVSFLFKEIYIDLGIAVNDETAKETPIGDPVVLIYNQAEFLKNRIEFMIKKPFEIKEQSQFSLNDFLIEIYSNEDNQISETKLENVNEIYDLYFSEDELNIIATGIYQTILDTNFKNISKHISDKLPAFVSQAGLEANVHIGYDFTTEDRVDDLNQPYTMITEITFSNLKDLTFNNPNNYSYYIEVNNDVNEHNQNVLTFQLYGTPFINTYSHYFAVHKEILQGETLWPSNDVSPGEKELVDAGYSGYRSIVARKTKISYPGSNGLKEVNQILSEDIYMPKDAIFKVFDPTSNDE